MELGIDFDARDALKERTGIWNIVTHTRYLHFVVHLFLDRQRVVLGSIKEPSVNGKILISHHSL